MKTAQDDLRRWRALLWIVPTAIVAMAVLVLAARWLRELPAVELFIVTYPGTTPLPQGAAVGLPSWLGWQHFLNVFLLVLIVKSGWSIRTTRRPAAYWTRMTGPVRAKRPPKRIALEQWFHLSLDALWIANGALFIVLLFVSGHWMRIVPTSLDVVPGAVSTAIQYASLEWPTDNGWVNYNSLQVLAYFATVFLAAPLAVISGIRMSPIWPASANRLNRLYPIEVARALHFPAMLYFVLFTIVHVTLVLATGALRNLNHIYAANDEASWVGFWLFVLSVIAMAAAWIAARPTILRPLAALSGKLSR